MALVSYRLEDCSGPNGTSIHGRAWSDGKGIWDVLTGGFVYQTNAIRNADVGPLLAIAVDSSLPATLGDQAIEADVPDGGQLVVRHDSDNGYLAYRLSGSLYLYRVDAGVATFLDSGSYGSGKVRIEAIGSTINVSDGVSLRATAVDATYTTGRAGIQIVLGGVSFDNIEVFVDEALITTPPPTTPPPSTAPLPTGGPTTPPPTSNPLDFIQGLGYTAVAFPSGTAAAGTLHPDGTVWLKAYTTATDILTDACWDTDGNVYFAYKVGAAVRIGKWDGRDNLQVVATWDVALATMDSANGRAMLDWRDGILWVWVHNVSTLSNLPQIYQLDDVDGSVIGGAPWASPSRSPSAAVEAANPGGANFGYYPAIRVSDSRVFLLGMDNAKEHVYLEIRNRSTAAQILNDTLQTEASPDETYPRGLTLDHVNEYCFVTWADFNDVASSDEPNRASYDRDGTLRWTNSTHPAGYDFVGGVAYDENNDQLYFGGGVDSFGQTNESVTVASAATGARTSGSVVPNTGAVVLNVGMYAPDDGVIISNGGTIFRYTTALTNPEEWKTILAATSRVMRTDYLFAALTGTGAPTTPPPTTIAPTAGPTTPGPTTVEPTTSPELTFPPVTPTTPITTFPPVTTPAPSTLPPSTAPPTSFPGTTEPPTLDGDIAAASIAYVPVMDQLVVRAWVKNTEDKVRDEDLVLTECLFELVDELGNTNVFVGVADELGTQYARFVIPQARLFQTHVSVANLTLQVSGGPLVGPSPIMLPVN